MPRDPWDTYRSQLEDYARQHGLSRAAARGYAQLAVWSAYYGEPAPPIVSGLRSRERQRELQRKWDRGDRAGLAARPADRSAHVDGDAFDVARTRSLPWWHAWAHLVGLRSGHRFGDDVHFDTRVGL